MSNSKVILDFYPSIYIGNIVVNQKTKTNGVCELKKGTIQNPKGHTTVLETIILYYRSGDSRLRTMTDVMQINN